MSASKRPSYSHIGKIILPTIFILIGTISFLLYVNSIDSDCRFWTFLGISRASHDPVTYLPYTFGYAALLQTLHAYEHVEWRNLVILDNSWDHHAFHQRHHLMGEFSSLTAIVRTPVHLRFSQLQGMIDGMAREQGEEVYLWGHTDVILLRNQSHPYARMLKGLEMVRSSNRLGLHAPVGLVFYKYDLLSAVFTHPSSAAPWDPAMPQYGSDCDRYHRLRLAGYSIIEDPVPIGHIVHTHAVLSHEQKTQLWESSLTLDEQVKMLDELNSATEQYAWRNGAGQIDGDREEITEENDWHDGIQQYDREAAAAEGQGGRTYFEAKWGPFDCELGGRVPFFDVPSIEE